MNRAAITDCLERRKHVAHELGDDRLDGITRELAGLADAARMVSVLREEIAYAVEQRDELDDETREPWQVLIEIDEEAPEALS
jgi:hypothetical protein